MPQLPSSQRKRAFYKQTFEIRDKGKIVYSHTFTINPSEMTIEEPPRINAVQTLGGAYVSHFGQGLHNVTIGGTTGYNRRMSYENGETDGYTEFHNFRRQIYRYFVETKSTQVELYWYNWEDEEYYKVIPQPFRLMRNVNEPTLYRYEFRFLCIERLENALSGNNQAMVLGAGAGSIPSSGGVSLSLSILNELRDALASGR